MAGATVGLSSSREIVTEQGTPFSTSEHPSTIRAEEKLEMSKVVTAPAMSISASTPIPISAEAAARIGGSTASASTNPAVCSVTSYPEVGRPLATVNLGDFATLLNPKNLESCVCCNSSLLNHTPPSLFVGEKTEILKSFCDILNLSFNPMMMQQNNTNHNNDGSTYQQNSSSSSNPTHQNDEDIDESMVDFPFCFYCTKSKVIKLTSLHEKLQVLQNHFDKLKEVVLKDILRVFISNMVAENHIPLKTVREGQTHEKMYQLFKRHSERKSRKMTEQEVQTDISAVNTPLSTAPLHLPTSLNVESYSYNSSSSKRRKIATRKPEYHYGNQRTSKKRGSQTPHNYEYNHQYTPAVPPEPVMEQEVVSSYEPSCSSIANDSGHPNSNSIYPANLHNGRNLSYHPSEDPSFENAVNGTYMMDDNGLLGLGEDYLSSIDYNFDKDGHGINGFPSFDHASLNDEFQNVLGLVDGLETDGSISVEVPMEPVVAKKSSPSKYPPSPMNDSQVVVLPDNKIRIRTRGVGVKINCKICDKLISRSGMKQHVDEMHGDDKPYKCRGCDKRFARRDHHHQHEERHVINSKRNYFCHRCGEDSEMISGKYQYIDHCVKVHKIEDDVLEVFHYCDADDCHASFKVKVDHINHLKSHWNLRKKMSLICNQCEKTFADKNRFDTHIQEAHRSNMSYFDCQYCHMGFEEEEDFDVHREFHKVKIPEERTHACDICGKAFETQNRMRCHKYNVHVSKRREKPEKTSASSVASPSQNSQQSQSDSIASPSVVFPADKPELICNVCGKTYTHKKRFDKHLLKHNSIPEEEEEDEENADDDVVDTEVEPVDPDDEDFEIGNELQCKYCSKRLKTKHEKRRHMAVKHRNKYLVGAEKHCVVCWHKFKNDRDLQRHYDQKHSRYQCPECKKQFSNSMLLSQHMKRHSPDLPFACKICKERFSMERVLKMHCKRVHGKSADQSESGSEEEEEDLEELENTLSPANHLLNQDEDEYMLNLFP